jgi:hypothetical protein
VSNSNVVKVDKKLEAQAAGFETSIEGWGQV